MDKFQLYICLQMAWNKSTAGSKLTFFLGPSLISTRRFLSLAEALRVGYVAACSTALRSATEKNDMGDYVTVPCPSKMTDRSSTADWLKFW